MSKYSELANFVIKAGENSEKVTMQKLYLSKAIVYAILDVADAVRSISTVVNNTFNTNIEKGTGQENL